MTGCDWVSNLGQMVASLEASRITHPISSREYLGLDEMDYL